MLMEIKCKNCGADLLNLENNPNGVKKKKNERYIGEADDKIYQITRETTEFLTSYEDIEKYKKFMEQHPPKTTITIIYNEKGIEKSINDFNLLQKKPKKLDFMGADIEITATCNKCGATYSGNDHTDREW